VALNVFGPTAYGADWLIVPSVTAQQTYSDNFRLAPRGREESEWITEISPGVSVSGRGARLQVDAQYALNYQHYLKNSEESGINHTLGSTALLDAWNKELFVQAAASVSMQTVSTLGPQAQSSANVTDNRTEVRTAMISPYWVRSLGSWGRADARYTWSRTETSGEFDVYSGETRSINLGLSSGPAFNDLGWGLSYRKSESESSSGAFDQRESETSTASLRYRLFPTFTLTGTVGYESNGYTSIDQGDTSGTTWSVGGDWAPSPRTRVSGSFGERYFGNTYKLDASHRTRLTTWTLSYSEDVTDAPTLMGVPASANTAAAIDRLFLTRIPDPRERQLAVQTFITQNALPLSLNSPVQFLTNQVTLVKRWDAGFGILGVRSTFLLNVFWLESSNLSVGAVNGPFDPFAISNTIEQVGASAALSYRLSQRTAVTSSFGQSVSRYTDTGREDTNRFVRLGVSRQIQPRVTGAINVRMVEQDSDDPNAGYREKAIIGTLNMRF
jgi:uncharacterized protein (PEP-CTERM system associated)